MGLRPIISNKNVVQDIETVTSSTQATNLVLTKDTATNIVEEEVQRGCKIFGLNLSFDICGTGTSGTIQKTNVYLIKNPGSNLTVPSVFSVGTSNEKKFVFRQWSFMTMRNQDGNPPFHIEEYVKIPRVYQRMGADDTIQLVWANDTLTGHLTWQCIYKWYL